jgi:hypothetical protein
MTDTKTLPGFSVPCTISEERISDLLCCALEGGSNYWYTIEKFVKPPTLVFRTDKQRIFKHLDYPLNEGGALIILDTEGEGEKTYRLDRATIQNGLLIMAGLPKGKGGHHWGDFLNQNEDAITGDVFLQCCLFGEIIYG